jgi:Ca-activated chloride channel family protein
MQADDSDVERLVKLFSKRRVKTETESTDLKADIWQEEGPWLLLLVLPIVALWPRKGWLLCVALYMLPFPQPAYASAENEPWPIDTENLWSRADQKAMKAFNSGDMNQAAELFTDDAWKAAAYYRAGDFDKSNKLLDSPASSNGYYNKGNALAKLGNYEDAIKAYEQALKIEPGNEDARYNRELVKKALEKQQQQNSQQQDQAQDPSQQQQQENEQQEQSGQQQQDQQQSNQQQQDNQSAEQQQGDKQKEKEQEQDQLTDINETDTEKKPEKEHDKQPDVQQAEEEQQDVDQQQQLEAQQQDEAFEQEDAETVENEQAMEQWLRRIPDDPGGLMRRKFIYQYRQMPNQAEATEPW